MTRADSVFSDLRHRIVEGQIPINSKLSEPELAKYYQISRTTLRDALSRVENCGLLQYKANIGYSVVTLSKEKLMGIFQVRESLESLACRLATAQLNLTDIKQLKMQLQKKHIENAQPIARAKHSVIDDYFYLHYQVVKASQNALLVKLLNEQQFYLIKLYMTTFRPGYTRSSTDYQEYLTILQAMENRDSELAELLMRRHISASCQYIQSAMP
ncbi:GntR family transcriptional regulator [Paraglaciecola aquimarina]|uniref:GntR family transcriptional regulator n=1 Tax=Paraglaciecola aquimarina TaxID=1235557 RepID=A0ABU3SYU0_9ALTE|nr:GntR family transcriptional regulator [Paraglaciecola aquimarina]MDU0355181.1 GntR family transcriptional regulator [Paraglaciecola aquimarina]